MKKITYIFFLYYLVDFTTAADEVLHCTDPHTGLHYPINSTWPSTTFCGTYTCHAIVEEENGESKKVPKIVPYINEGERKAEADKKDDKEMLENGSGDFASDEKENRQSHEISDSDWDENEFGKLYELYKIASDLGESIKKVESELKRRDGAPEKNANRIEKEYKKTPITNADNFCGNLPSNGENDIHPSSNPPPAQNDEMTAAMYKDYNKYLAQYYAQYPYYNYLQAIDKSSDSDTSPSNIDENYERYATPEGYVYDADYYNHYYSDYVTESYPEYYSVESPKPKVYPNTSHVNVDQSHNHIHTHTKQSDKQQQQHRHRHHHHNQNVDMDKHPQAQNLTDNEQKHDISNYETEYHAFYHDFIAKHPNSTVYSSKPTAEDTKHFYSLYYEKFPYKRPVTQATTEADTTKHNHGTQNRADLTEQKEVIVSEEEQENSQSTNTPPTSEFKTTEKDFDKKGALEELQNWADYRHPKETIQWRANPFDATRDKDVYLTTSRHSRDEITPGKYDWINSKLGQFGVPLPAKPHRSLNLNPLLSSALLQPKFRNVLRRLPGVHHPHLIRRRRSPKTKTFMTVKGCPLQTEPGYFKNGDPNQHYPQCCPQKIY